MINVTHLLHSLNITALQLRVAVSTLPLCVCHSSSADWTQVCIHHRLSIVETRITTID